jgi:hypothetical protein
MSCGAAQPCSTLLDAVAFAVQLAVEDPLWRL